MTDAVHAQNLPECYSVTLSEDPARVSHATLSEDPARVSHATLSEDPARVSHATLMAVAAGSLPGVPEGLEAKLEMISMCLQTGRRLGHWLAILVARVRDDYPTPSAWLDDMEARYGWQRAHIHHMRQAGALVWRHRSDGVALARLMDCDMTKLVSIARLPEQLTGPFLAKVAAEDMTREDVRLRVNAWLAAGGKPGGDEGEVATGGRRRVVQGDFFDRLAAAADAVGDWAAWAEQLRGRELKPASALNTAIASIQIIDAVAGRAGNLPLVIEALREEADKLEQGLVAQQQAGTAASRKKLNG